MNRWGENEEAGRAGYDAARSSDSAAVAERPGIGLLELTGRDRQTFLQGMVSNDVLSLTPGQSLHAAFLDSTAHVLADLIVHCRPDLLLLETDARSLDRLAKTLDKYLIMEKVRIRDVSAQWALTTVLGGGAEAKVFAAMEGQEGFVIARPPRRMPGCDVWLEPAAASAFRQTLKDHGAMPLTPEAWDVLRVEAGLPAWGQELDETVLFPETGMDDAVSYSKGCYIGQEIVARISARGHTNRGLRAILMAPGEAVPTPGDTVHLPQDLPEAGREIGRITSAVHSPKHEDRALALAYVRREHFAPGTPVSVHLRQPNGAVFAAPGEVREPGT